jgi:hypothetical protein
MSFISAKEAKEFSTHANLNIEQYKMRLAQQIESNAKQTILYQNRVVPCEPFGIVTLEKMVQSAYFLQRNEILRKSGFWCNLQNCLVRWPKH